MTQEEEKDYYQVLQCEKSASHEELKKSYQKLILSLHPDKLINTANIDKERTFHLIQKAWSVLKDSESRKKYDATRSCLELTDILLYDSIRLSDMEYNEADNVYSYSCRCGGTYILDGSDCPHSTIHILCDECSFSIAVSPD